MYVCNIVCINQYQSKTNAFKCIPNTTAIEHLHTCFIHYHVYKFEYGWLAGSCRMWRKCVHAKNFGFQDIYIAWIHMTPIEIPSKPKMSIYLFIYFYFLLHYSFIVTFVIYSYDINICETILLWVRNLPLRAVLTFAR